MDFKKYYCQEELVNLFTLKNLKTEEPKLLKILEIRKYFQDIWDKKETYTEEEYTHKREIGKVINHFSNLVFKEIYNDPKIDKIIDLTSEEKWDGNYYNKWDGNYNEEKSIKAFEKDFENIPYLKFITQEKLYYPKISEEDDKYFLNNMTDYDFLEKMIKKYDFSCEECFSFTYTFENNPIEDITNCQFINFRVIDAKLQNEKNLNNIFEGNPSLHFILDFFDSFLENLEEE